MHFQQYRNKVVLLTNKKNLLAKDATSETLD